MFFLSILLFTTTGLPVCAIDSHTYIFPYIGPGAEKFKEHAHANIDLTPIKLPERIFGVELLENERNFARNFFKDGIGLWTSPFRMQVKDLFWAVPASGAIVALLLTDEDFQGALSNNYKVSSTQKDISSGLTYLSGYATSFGLPGVLILSGAALKNDRLKETGVLQYQGLASGFTLGLILQRIFGRAEPFKGKRIRGEFFKGKNAFPSGHAISAWTLATVAAHEYWHTKYKWVPILAYSLAIVASSARVTGNNHFPSDVFVGALIGYLIGRYTVKYHSEFADVAKDYRNLQNTNEQTQIPRDGSF